MASVAKREWTYKGEKRSAWVVRWKVGKVHRSRQFKVRSEGDKFVKILKSANPAGAMARSFTVQDACERLLRLCEQRHRDGDGMERVSLAQLWSAVDLHIVPFIGALKLKNLSPLAIDDWIYELRNHRLKPRSPQQVRRATQVLCRAITEAQRLRIVSRNVMKDVPPRRPVIAKTEIEIPTKEQLRTLLASASSRSDELIVHIAAFTGLRSGEICALAWSNIDFEAAKIKVRQSINREQRIKKPKTRSGIREVPISSVLAMKLREFRLASDRSRTKGQPAAIADLVFAVLAKRGLGKNHGLLTSHRVGSEVWKRVCKCAGLTDQDGKPLFRFHSLRHFAASLLIESGLPPKRIQQIMGHTSIKMTFDTYGHLFPDDGAAQRAVEDISKHFGG